MVLLAGCGGDDGIQSDAQSPATAAAIVVLAGNVGGAGFLDGTGAAVRFAQPSAVAFDGKGNLYIADGSTLRRLDTAGVVSTLAGSPTETGSIDGTGAAARFRSLSGVAVDASGTAYVVDSEALTVRSVTPSGVVSTLAGADGVPGPYDGPLSVARFVQPTAVAIDPASGSLYIADKNATIRKISNGFVSTLAGSPGFGGSVDGVGTAARFDVPAGIAVDANGDLAVTDVRNGLIRKVTSAGVVTTIAGSLAARVPQDGVGRSAAFGAPSGITIDASGNLFVSDFSQSNNVSAIRRITPDTVVTTLVGGATYGATDGAGSAASFGVGLAVAADRADAIFVADRDNATIRRVSVGGVVTTVAGSPPIVGSADGVGSAAMFCLPRALAIDTARNVYVVDACDVTIRKVTAAGVVTTIAGKSGVRGSVDGIGGAARFTSPTAVVADGSGNLYVADGNVVRKVTSTGVVITIAGTGVPGGGDGPASSATFNSPGGLALDTTGNLYVADNSSLRKIDANSMVTTLAGGYQRFGSADGPGATASFSALGGIALDGVGNVYLTDDNNQTVRKLSTSGIVSTIAGQAGTRGAVDGPGASARFMSPYGIVASAAGDLFVSDTRGHTIRKVDRAGNVTTVVGVADGVGGVRLGALPGHLDQPQGLAIDSMNVLYVTDNEGVLRITLP